MANISRKMKNSNTGDKGAAGQSPLLCGALAAVNTKLWMSQAGGKGGENTANSCCTGPPGYKALVKRAHGQPTPVFQTPAGQS